MGGGIRSTASVSGGDDRVGPTYYLRPREQVLRQAIADAASRELTPRPRTSLRGDRPRRSLLRASHEILIRRHCPSTRRMFRDEAYRALKAATSSRVLK